MSDRYSRIAQLLNQGMPEAAEKYAFNATRHFPSDPHIWFLLGVAQHFQSKREPALSAFEHCLHLHPQHIQAMQAKATVLSELGHSQAAMEICRDAVELSPNDPDLIANLGTALEKIGNLNDALQQFDQALQLNPRHLHALLNYGALLLRMRKLDESLTHHQQFILAYPEYGDAYYNLSQTWLAMHRYQEAILACDDGLSAEPRHPGLHLNRGIALAALGHFGESQAELAKAQILDPNLLAQLLPEIRLLPQTIDPYASAEMVFLEAHAKALQDCYWENRKEFLTVLGQFIEHGTPSTLGLQDKRLAFSLLGLPISADQHLQALKQISASVQDCAWLYNAPPFQHSRPANSRIRIGYVSPDFREHPIGHLTKHLFASHDKNKFEVFCYSLVQADDAVQQEIIQGCDHWRDISNLSNVSAAQGIFEDSIDILIDLAGYTTHSRTEIFALRPAPIQVNYLGYPGTMGATFMDYLIGDPVVTPPELAHHFTEQLILMAHTYQPNCRPEAPMEPPSRSECGLPEKAFVFCGFNQAFKISPEIFDIWMRLLHGAPGSVLWLLDPGPAAEQNLRREARTRGIDDTRLIFAPRQPWLQHLARQQHADLMLDTYPYNAHTTASDALWAGVPLVTCMGQTFPSRVAASLLHAAGMPELVTTSFDAYEQLAARLASSPLELQEIRLKLAHNRQTAPLFDRPQFVRGLESLYEQMYQARR